MASRFARQPPATQSDFPRRGPDAKSPKAFRSIDDRPTGTFLGWWIVAVAVVGQCLSVGPLLSYTFGIFAKLLASQFGANRGSISLAVTCLNLMVAASSVGAGRLVDRFGGRRVIALSTVALSGCLLALSTVTGPLWHLFALYALAGVVGAGSTPVAYARVVSNWFDRNRGLALGVTSTGIGLGVAVMPSIAEFLIQRMGWRQAYLVLGGVVLAFGAPIVAIFLRNAPEDVGLSADGIRENRQLTTAPGPATGLGLAEALRTVVFWQLCAIFFLVSACANGTIAHLAPMLSDRGISGRNAASAISFFGAATIVGRLGNGYLVDRLPAQRVAAMLFFGAALGLPMLLVDGGRGWFFAAAALVGLAIGAESDVMPFLVSRYFGMRSMGALFGCIFAAYTLGAAVGAYLLGAGFDATGSYRAPLEFATAAMLLAAVATLALRSYENRHRYQTQETQLNS